MLVLQFLHHSVPYFVEFIYRKNLHLYKFDNNLTKFLEMFILYSFN